MLWELSTGSVLMNMFKGALERHFFPQDYSVLKLEGSSTRTLLSCIAEIGAIYWCSKRLPTSLQRASVVTRND